MSLPSAARAIGLGDIRVDSALNEPLSAQIDIVGATRDELAALTAKVASREVFQRHGADRPSFLASATFKVGLDSQGRPVLNIRSSDAFTDPLVSFLVDLRWGNGELVREYSLLLDPAGFASSNHAAEPAYATAAPAPASVTVAAPPAPVASVASAPAVATAAAAAPAPETMAAASLPAPVPTHHRVTSHDTLRAIARRTGARTELALQRTMIAMYRANPHAFDGNNINRLHLGAVLALPSAEDVAAIPAADARREVRAHMTAWRLDGRPPAVVRRAAETAVAATVAPAATVPATTVAPVPAAAPVSAAEQAAKQEADAAIKDRLQTLEQELDEVHKQLAAEHVKIQDLKHASERAAATADAQEVPSSSTVQAAEAEQSTPDAQATPGWLSGKSLIGTLATGMGLLVAGFVYLRRRQPKVEPHPYDRIAAEEHLAKLSTAADEPAAAPAEVAAAPPPRQFEAPEPAPAHRPSPAARVTPAPAAATETTVSLAVDAEALERSYLDSMAIDSLGIDTSVLDSGSLETAEHDMTDVRAAARHVPIADPSSQDTAEHDVTGLETIAIDASDLDAEIDREALNTAVLDVKAFHNTVNKTELDYNLLDLDATGQHVEMPSKLHDRVEVSERRTNIADVLKAAIERDPYRRDLRMKLLETYYSAASLNQRAFLEIVRKAARDRDFLSAEDWTKVREMGREIAGGDPLFDAPSKDDDLADCA